MSLFNKENMLEEVNACKAAGGVLLDVREPDEYADGHIPGSINVPVGSISEAAAHIPGKDTLVCVYCLSGYRAEAAAKALGQMGYTNVKNLGGIKAYKGKLER